MSPLTKGLWLGFIGVAIFSFTLPVTKLGLAAGLSAPFISFGRAVLAGLISLIVLRASGARVPNAQERKFIFMAVAGIVVGWPTLSTIGLLTATPSHAAIVNGLLPFSTAFIGAMLTQTWPRRSFWLCALLGAVVVSGYAWLQGGGAWVWADAIFFVGVLMGGLGYAAGARASETMPGWHVISWALVAGLPITVPVALWTAPEIATIPLNGWLCFLYLALMSQYIGFFFWYRGLQLGGIAKVSQVQLLQMFLTLGVSAVMVGEALTPLTWIAAGLTVAIIAISKRL